MKYLIAFFVLIAVLGCATWDGVKQDTKSGANWTKEKVHEGAAYVEKKTQ